MKGYITGFIHGLCVFLSDSAADLYQWALGFDLASCLDTQEAGFVPIW